MKDLLLIIKWKFEDIQRFFKFLSKIKSFKKLYYDYEYDGDTCEFIIENYTTVLCERTKLMSKPTYYARDVIQQIDEWYADEE